MPPGPSTALQSAHCANEFATGSSSASAAAARISMARGLGLEETGCWQKPQPPRHGHNLVAQRSAGTLDNIQGHYIAPLGGSRHQWPQSGDALAVY